MSKTETQSEALELAEFFGGMKKSSHRWYDGVPVHEKAASELRRLDAENKALREVLQAVEMDVVYVGSGENVISDATRAKVEAVLGKFGAPQAVAQPVGDEREAFEAWAAGHYPGIVLDRESEGYRRSLAQEWWTAWQASRAVQAAAKNGGAA